MGIQQQDPEYLRAKYAFIRDLIQFHESRGTGLQCDPKINGKEVDLYLLYQIVTSHGGWEKINLRNEWDKLLEHFKLPRSTNGGLAIKQIYLRYLELYEKIHYLGEDVDTKEEQEDEYLEDFRGRRRYPNKLASSHHSHHHSSSSSHHHHHPPKEITDHNRSQLGLSSRIKECSDYEGLLLSLQSPLPNEQDMAISVCTLLSNETKHVLRFSKSPAILNMLLAHAGIYQDCGMRLLMEETYKEGRDMDYAEFWDEVLHQPDTRQLLCECFVKRVNASLGLTDDEGTIISQIQEIEDGDLPEEEKHALGTALRLKLTRLRESRLELSCVDDEEPCASSSSSHPLPLPISSKDELPESKVEPDDIMLELDERLEPNEKVEPDEGAEPSNSLTCNGIPSAVKEGNGEWVEQSTGNNNNNTEKEIDDALDIDTTEGKEEQTFRLCCSSCPCQRTENFVDTGAESSSTTYDVEFSIQRPSSKTGQVTVDEAGDGPANSLPFTLTRANQAGDKVGQRICQIAHILRNLSFEQDNALIMAKSPTLMRFLLVAANCTFGSLAQASFDIIGNISSYIRLEEPLRDPLSSLFLTLVTSGVFSTDRFKILRSLESLRELTRVEGNEGIIARYIESRVYRRMCDLLTLSDIMLLIYTLECILSMTGLGEAVCDEIVRVQGSVATLVSLVTVEAQSYGPKGCILMRVVETVTGATTTAPGPSSSLSTSSTVVPSSSSSATVTSTVATTNSSLPSVQPVHPPSPMAGLPQAPQAVIQPVAQSQHLLQQVLQQPPNPIYAPSANGSTTPSRPSPASSPGLKIVTGTTTVVPPVAPGQVGLQPTLVQQHPPLKSVSTIPTHLLNPSSNPNGSNQVFNNPASSTNLINHLNALSTPLPPHSQQHHTGQHSQVATAVAVHQQQSAVLPKPSSALPMPVNHVQFVNNTGGVANDSIATPPPPPGATFVVHQPHKLPNPTPPTAVVVPATTPGLGSVVANGAPSSCLVTANLPQISNHSLNQHHVVTPSISLVTPRGTLSEEAWAIAWLKGTFESVTGTSIEQGEIYRMYSAARKNPSLVLSLEQFVQCVKCAYGANVGPVIKQFGGGTSLPFFEGIKPKIAIRAIASGVAGAATIKVAGPGTNALVTAVSTAVNNPHHQIITPSPPVPATLPVVQTFPPPLAPPPPPQTVISSPIISQADVESNALVESTLSSSNCAAATTGNHNSSPSNSNNNAVGGATATIPVSVHIPSREAKPSLSPILQATLSQPPKAKNNAASCGGAPLTPPSAGSINNNATSVPKRIKNQKGKDSKKQSTGRSKKGAPVNSTDETTASATPTSAKPASSGKGKSTFSPASSAIRSLLASKVVQRQQHKLQQQIPKTIKSKLGDKLNSIEDGTVGYTSTEIIKMNGVGPDVGIEKLEESSASSSLLSSDGSDNSVKTVAPLTSFHGVLHNGQANSDLKNELNLDGSDDEMGKNKGSMKGMLIDLLERRVPSREPVNGMITGREIRISEKGLELIEKMEENHAISRVNESALTNRTNSNSSSTSGSTCTSNDVQESQKMTFYSSTSDAQVTLQGQASSTACVIPASAVGSVLSGSAVTLASGGGGGGDGASSLPPSSNNTPLTLRTASGQQLAGLKRPSSPLSATTGASSNNNNNNNNNNNTSVEADDLPPPAKKMAMDKTLVESESASSNNNISSSNANNSNATSLPTPVPVVTSAGSASAIPQILANNVTLVTTNQAMISTATTVVPSTVSTPSLPPGSGAQVVQLPLRLSVNPQNPQQLTFTRQLVLPTGQQLLLSTGNSQSSIQGQVIISKPQGATNDQMPKAIIILQQPQQQATTTGSGVNSQPVVTTTSIQNIQSPATVQQTQQQHHHQQNMLVGNTVVPVTVASQQQVSHSSVIAPNKPQVVAIQQHPTAARHQVPSGPMVQAAQTPMVHQVAASPLHHAAVKQQTQHSHHQLHVASSQLHHSPHHHHSSTQVHALAAAKQQAVNSLQFEGIRANSYPHLTQDQLDLEFPFLCEWSGCGLRFLRPQQVSMHALKIHCPEALVDAVRCEWGQNGCDPLLRKRFSLMTHLQDRHCSKQALEMALYRRKNKIEPPPVPQQPIHHPGYAPNAAFHAIKRHAMTFMSTKEHLHDDNEGPVTKSIRLTSALILRNLVNYSALGRRMLQGYESHLSAIAMSNVESSRTIAQLLHDMNEQPKGTR